jgi:hypothetical protein
MRRWFIVAVLLVLGAMVFAQDGTDLMAQKVATTFMTDANGKELPSWADFIAYLQTAAPPPKGEFESQAVYAKRIGSLGSKLTFSIKFVPVLGQYSLENHTFEIKLSFLHLTGSANRFNRQNGHAIMMGDNFLMTSDMWTTDVDFWVDPRFDIAQVTGKYTTRSFFLKEDNIAQAQKIRENESAITAIFSGILERVDTVTKSYQVPQGTRSLYGDSQYDLNLTIFKIQPTNMIVKAAGQVYTWKF